MQLSLRLCSICILLLSSIFPIAPTFVYAADELEADQATKTEVLDSIEEKIDLVLEKASDIIKDEEIQEQIEQTAEEIGELIEEQQEEIEEATSVEEVAAIMEETKKRVVLKTFDGLTDHDDLEETIQVEGGAVAQEEAIETAVQAMVNENTTTVMIQTRDALEDVDSRFATFDPAITLTLLFEEGSSKTIEVTIPQGSMVQQEVLEELGEAVLPDSLLGYRLIKPEVYTIGEVTLAGEEFDRLRGMRLLEAPYYQKALQGMPVVTVGVVDTGVDPAHPDLQSVISTRIAGYDFVNKDDDPMDDHVHGTHVAGTIAAAANGQGVMGVNTQVEIVPLKICTASGYCPSYAIYNAVKYAADEGIDVLNMSLGGRGSLINNTTCQAIEYAAAKGTIAVVAAGNANMHVLNSIPGACPHTITVGAIDAQLQRADFSNYGAQVDIAAPGVGIYSTIPGGGYKMLDGTSMAAPHVTALVAAIRAVKGEVDTADAQALLLDHTLAVTHEENKPIGQLIDMPSLMQTLGIMRSDIAVDTGATTVIVEELPPPFAVNHEQIILQVGDFVTIDVHGGEPTYRIERDEEIIGFSYMDNRNHDGVQIASAGGEVPVADFGASVTDPIPDFDTEDLDEVWGDTGVFLDLESDDEAYIPDADEIYTAAEEVPEDIAIANNATYSFKVFGLQPGQTHIRIIDARGEEVAIPITIQPKTLFVDSKSRRYHWSVKNGTYVFQYPQLPNRNYIRSVRRRSSYRQLYPGPMTGILPLNITIYNYHERKRQTMQHEVYVGTAAGYETYLAEQVIRLQQQRDELLGPPEPLQANYEHIEMQVGDAIELAVGGGRSAYTVSKTNDMIRFGSIGESSVRIASAGGALGGGFVRAQELVPDIRNDVPVGFVEDEDVDVGDARDLFTSVVSEDIAIANTATSYKLTVTGLQPGESTIMIQDQAGQTLAIPVHITEKEIWMKPDTRMYIGPELGGNKIVNIRRTTGESANVRYYSRGKYRLDATRIEGYTTLAIKTYNYEEQQSQTFVYTIRVSPTRELQPLTVDKERLELEVGQVASLRINGGMAGYTLTRDDPQLLGFGRNRRYSGIGIASADAETIDHVALGDIGSEEVSPVYYDEEASVESGTLVIEPMIIEDGLDIASASSLRQEVWVMGVQPGETTLRITDARGTEKEIPVIIKEKILDIPLGKTIGWGYRDRERIYEVCRNGLRSDNEVALPTSYRRKTFYLHAQQPGMATVELCIVNMFERKKQKMLYTVLVRGEHPTIQTNHEEVNLQVGEVVDLDITGGFPTYTIAKSNEGVALGYGAFGEQMMLAQLDHTTPPVAFSEGDGTLPPDDTYTPGEGVVDSGSILSDSGVVLAHIRDAELESIPLHTLQDFPETDAVEVASVAATQHTHTIKLMGLTPGQTQLTITDKMGQQKQITVNVQPTIYTQQSAYYHGGTRRVPVYLDCLLRVNMYQPMRNWMMAYRIYSDDRGVVDGAVTHRKNHWTLYPIGNGTADFRVRLYNYHEKKTQYLTFRMTTTGMPYDEAQALIEQYKKEKNAHRASQGQKSSIHEGNVVKKDASSSSSNSTSQPLQIEHVYGTITPGHIFGVEISGGEPPYDIKVDEEQALFLGTSLEDIQEGATIQSTENPVVGEAWGTVNYIGGHNLDSEEVYIDEGVTISSVGHTRRNATYYFLSLKPGEVDISVEDKKLKKLDYTRTSSGTIKLKKGETKVVHVPIKYSIRNVISNDESIMVTCPAGGNIFRITGMSPGRTEIGFTIVIHGKEYVYDILADVEVEENPAVTWEVACGDRYENELAKEGVVYLYDNRNEFIEWCNGIPLDTLLEFVQENANVESLKSFGATMRSNFVGDPRQFLVSLTLKGDYDETKEYLQTVKTSSEVDRCIGGVLLVAGLAPGASKTTMGPVKKSLKEFIEKGKKEILDTLNNIPIGRSVGVKIYTKTTKEILDDVEVKNTLERMSDKNGKYPEDGTPFRNEPNKSQNKILLPEKDSGYYKERTVDTPGLTHRGQRRIIEGQNGELYYTDDHYDSFIRLN